MQVRAFINQTSRFDPYSEGDQLTIGPVLEIDHTNPFVTGPSNIVEEILNKAYEIGNRMYADADGQAWPRNVRSLSVGDVLSINSNTYGGLYAVDRVGFKKIND